MDPKRLVFSPYDGPQLSENRCDRCGKVGKFWAGIINAPGGPGECELKIYMCSQGCEMAFKQDPWAKRYLELRMMRLQDQKTEATDAAKKA